MSLIQPSEKWIKPTVCLFTNETSLEKTVNITVTIVNVYKEPPAFNVWTAVNNEVLDKTFIIGDQKHPFNDNDRIPQTFMMSAIKVPASYSIFTDTQCQNVKIAILN